MKSELHTRHPPKGLRVPRRSVLVILVSIALVAASVVVARFTSSLEQNVSQFSLKNAPLGPAGLAIPAVSKGASVTASWYCTWSFPSQMAPTADTVIVVNGSNRSAVATLFTYGIQEKQTVDLPAHSVSRLPLSDTGLSLTGSASMVVRGGLVAVGIEETSGSTPMVTPCQTTPGFYWLVSGGFTNLGDQMAVSLFNPFGQDAVVDVSTIDESGLGAPGADQGLVVPAGHSITIDLSTTDPNQSNLAVQVRARSGRIVVSGFQERSDQKAQGSAFLPVTTRPSSNWTFPYLLNEAGTSLTLLVTNPSNSNVTLRLSGQKYQGTSLSSQAGSGSTLGATSVVVPPSSVARVPLSSTLSLPVNAQYYLSVTSLYRTGVLVSIENVYATSTGADNYAVTDGEPLQSSQWMVTEIGYATVPPILRLAIVTRDTHGNVLSGLGSSLQSGATPVRFAPHPKPQARYQSNLFGPAVVQIPRVSTNPQLLLQGSAPMVVGVATALPSSNTVLTLPVR